MSSTIGSGATSVADATTEASAIRKIAWRLVPFLGLMFFINFLDRTAISFAGPNGMTQDLGLSAAQFGFAAGIFFVGYILLEVPSNLALHRYGARRWLARIMVSWGVVSLLFTWVDSSTQLYWLRFILGIAEAGFFPGAILYLSTWVPSRHRSRILSVFYVAQPLTTVIGAPIASALIAMHGAFGLEGWRLMFFGVSIPAIIIGIVTYFYLPDRPDDARWLSADEKRWLNGELALEDRVKAASHGSATLGALRDGRVWLLSAIYFGFIYGLYALGFFLPTIISGFEADFGAKFTVMQKGFITAIPYLPAAIALLLWSRDASRRGMRPWHVGVPALVGSLSIPLALLMPTPTATIAVITVTACAIFSALPNFWSLPARFLHGVGAAAGIALINTMGNVAGFAAPYVTGAVRDATGSFGAPMVVVGLAMLVSAVLTFAIAGRIQDPDALARADARSIHDGR